MAIEKDIIFPAKRWSVLTETERPFKMGSRRSANIFFLTSGITKAQRVESTINCKNVNPCCGTKKDLDKADEVTKGYQDRCANKGCSVGILEVEPFYSRFARTLTWGKLADMPVVYVLTVGNAQRSNVAGGILTYGMVKEGTCFPTKWDCVIHKIPSAPFQTKICPAIWTQLHVVIPTFVIHGRLEVVVSYKMGKIADVV